MLRDNFVIAMRRFACASNLPLGKIILSAQNDFARSEGDTAVQTLPRFSAAFSPFLFVGDDGARTLAADRPHDRILFGEREGEHGNVVVHAHGDGGRIHRL